MTALTDARKAAIRDHLRTAYVDDPRAELKKVLIDPDISDKDFLTDEMIDELLSDVKSKAAAGGKRHYKRAIRVSRSPETWRHLEHYPAYQISSHGRLRSVMRAKDTDVLKPRFSWHYGKLVAAYNINDKDGIKRSRFVGTLMINAGFIKARQWGKEKAASN
jgi:hypothetical protein